jgi:GNAT superfamily N-acetyltransferase
VNPSPSKRDDGAITNRVERFDPARHDVSRFSCGNRVLDEYLHNTVARDEAQHTAATYVLIDAAVQTTSHRVFGYYTLNSFSIPRRQARRRDRDRHLGGYDPVPAVLIGRLALDRDFQGRGLGSALLTSALIQILTIRERMGVAVAVVHAIDDAAAAFYEHQGFTQFRDQPHHLYYPLVTFEAALASARSPGGT